MSNIEITDVSEQDFERIVELNLAEVAHTSTMSLEDIARLHAISAYHRVIMVDDIIAGFLLVMGPKSPYINDNYAWFKVHYPSYMYIDRVVLDAEYQGKQLGQLLYLDLFSWAQEQNVNHVVCEYNVMPPNLPSAKFHQRLGFNEVGFQWLPLNKSSTAILTPDDEINVKTHKKVSMQCCDLSHR
jgi:predicted GNAT superfamily acetyltransferase